MKQHVRPWPGSRRPRTIFAALSCLGPAKELLIEQLSILKLALRDPTLLYREHEISLVIELRILVVHEAPVANEQLTADPRRRQRRGASIGDNQVKRKRPVIVAAAGTVDDFDEPQLFVTDFPKCFVAPPGC